MSYLLSNLLSLHRFINDHSFSGTTIIRTPKDFNATGDSSESKHVMKKLKAAATELTILNRDMIQKDFWELYPFILQ